MNGSAVLDRPTTTSTTHNLTLCRCCGGDLIVVDINASGEAVRFSSCTRCEDRRWTRKDHAVDIADFLAEVRGADTRYQRS